MRKFFPATFIFLITGISCYAQLTGIKSIPGDYNNLTSAIAALNVQGVGTGGVIFNVAADFKEILSTPHAGYITTTTGSSTRPVTFQKSGSGSDPLITAPTGTGTRDAIIAFAGCDFVTFNGFKIQENTDNWSEDEMMEWGFAILKTSGTNGSQNITIKNCTVSLVNNYMATIGIYSGNHTPDTTASLTVTSLAGTNSNLKVFGNTIENCYTGIFLSGYADPAAPYAYYDQNNEVGRDGANIITNVGGSTIAAYGIFTKYQNSLKVANNHITSTMEGTQPHYGIFLTTSLNGSYDLYNNYVSIQFSGTGYSASFYPVYCDMGGNGTNNTVNVYNNTVTGCRFPTVANANQNAYFMYLNNLGVTTSVYGNVISNDTVGSPGVSAPGRVWYLQCNMATAIPGTLNLHDNSVTGNARIQAIPGGGGTNFIVANGAGNLLNMYNNYVADNVVASNGEAKILFSGISANMKNIYGNTVSNITKAEGPVYGIYYADFAGGSGNVYQNKIQNIEGLTGVSNITGIYHAAGDATNYYNNMVSDLRVLGASAGSGLLNQLSGILINGGSDVGVYNNTVYLASPASNGSNCGSSALYVSTNSGVDSRNNILVNNSVPVGTGRTVSFRLVGSGSLAYFSALSNNNDLYAGIPDATHVIFSSYSTSNYSYTDDINLGDYKARVYPREVQSVTELPTFVNIAVRPYNIHLKDNVATQCEAGGTPVSSPVAITADIDNQPRFPIAGYPVNLAFTPNAPDIGADEFGGLPNDITAPAISYTPLLNVNSLNARTLTVTISDGSGVPASGNGLPVLYWKVNAAPYIGVQGIPVSTNTFRFTFGGGVVIGDVVSYYIVAQDMAPIPNVVACPAIGAGGYSYSPPSCMTPPGNPSSYSIIPGISGVFHVGVGKDFATLTAAANMVNSRVLTGPLTLVLDDATYPAESFPVSFNSNAGSSSTNTFTVRPNTGVSPVFTSTTATGLLNLSGIDFFTLDGSNSGSNSKNLRISQTSTSIGYSYGINVLNYGGTDPATNVTIKNCIIQCTPVNSSVILRVPLVFSSAGGGYDNCIVDNNTIIGGLDGIRLLGSSTGIIHNGQITNNIIGSETDTLITVNRVGILIGYADNTLISGNDIMGPFNGSLNPGITGISIYPGCTNTKIRRNRIHEIYNDNPYDGWGACGIDYGSDASTITEITNNLIYNIKGGGSAPGLASTNPYGILISNGGNLKILFNTISLTGPFLSSLNDASSACIGISHKVADNSLEIRNNILRNSMVCNGIPNTFGKAYGIILEGIPSVFSTINNNDYFIDGYQGQIGQLFAQTGIVDYQTLPVWQAFTGQEANSVNIDPAFISSDNLVPTSASLNNQGAFITSEPSDFTGILRNNPPDVGAYEFGNDPVVSTLPANTVTSSSAVLTGSVNPAGNTVSTFFDYGKTTSYGTSLPATPGSISGSATIGIHLALAGLNQSTTFHYRARTVTAGGLTSFGTDMIFSTTSGPPENITLVNTISNDTCFNATQTITVAGTPDTFVVTPAGNVTMIAGQNIIFLPGTTVQPGGHLHGYISNQYCGTTAAPVMAVKSGEAETPGAFSQYCFRIYPNPTAGRFTLEFNSDTPASPQIEIFGMTGNKVFAQKLGGERKHEFSISTMPPGIYFIHVVTGENSATVKMIKL